MLLLSRRAGETILIGDDIEVTVLGFTGTAVRIGINAPVEICVDREEVRRRIDSDRRERIDMRIAAMG